MDERATIARCQQLPLTFQALGLLARVLPLSCHEEDTTNALLRAHLSRSRPDCGAPRAVWRGAGCLADRLDPLRNRRGDADHPPRHRPRAGSEDSLANAWTQCRQATGGRGNAGVTSRAAVGDRELAGELVRSMGWRPRRSRARTDFRLGGYGDRRVSGDARRELAEVPHVVADLQRVRSLLRLRPGRLGGG